MEPIKCKYCGKSYASPSEMRKRKCHSHPKGAWGGYCTPDFYDEIIWKAHKDSEDTKQWQRTLAEMEERRAEENAEFAREYKKHTPLLDCVLEKFGDEPSEYKLKIRNSDLNKLAYDLARGILSWNPPREVPRDVINTIYSLRDGCDYVLNHAEAQKEGFLSSWLDKVQQLKDEVFKSDFWFALYWLTKPIKDAKSNEKHDSIARVFLSEQVIPMLHSVHNKGDEKEIEVMHAVNSYVRELRSERGKRGSELLCKRINDYAFWGVLYCLYWMTLRPTPWDDTKVWPPIFEADETTYMKFFRDERLKMRREGALWTGRWEGLLDDDDEPYCIVSKEHGLGETLRTDLWNGEITENGPTGDFLTELNWKITKHDGRQFVLMSGEFWGINPNDDNNIYSGIDFSSKEVQPVIEEFAKWFHDDFFLGVYHDGFFLGGEMFVEEMFVREFSYDSSHIWWNIKEPIEICGGEPFHMEYLDVIKKLAEKLAQLLPYRIDKRTGKTVREIEKEGEKSLPNNSSPQNDDSGPLKELEGLIGLGQVKDEVRKLVELVKFNAARKANGLSAGGMTSHFVFTGNPGTGKTTVARIVADIYRQLGILKKGHLVEVDRSKLVAGYIGHTAIQTNAVVDSAMDGVLFIDEAYSLIAGGTSDFGSEAIATLLKRMEDARERIIVIVAGYSDEMSRFVKSNPGLESRFTKFIEFPDYSIDELVSIFDSIAKKNQFTCSSRAHELLRETIENAATDGHVSGNARYVRNLFDAVRERMARRVMKIKDASKEQLQTIEADDFGEQVGDNALRLRQSTAISDLMSEPATAPVQVEFNKLQYLKDLRWHTLGMRCDGGMPWRTILGENAVITSWQLRVRSNLECQFRMGALDGLVPNRDDYVHENYIAGFNFHIFHDGKSFRLKIWGEFWGNTPTKHFRIDFAAPDVQNDLAAAEAAYCAAWTPFGVNAQVNGNIGHHPENMWWNITVPFKDYDELVSEIFSQKLRDSLAVVANAFASLLKYRVPVNQ